MKILRCDDCNTVIGILFDDESDLGGPESCGNYCRKCSSGKWLGA